MTSTSSRTTTICVRATGGREELSFSANLTGNLALGRPWFLMEHATSAVNWRDVNTAKREGELARDALTHVGHGADAVCFFQWRQSRAGGERYHSAMVPHAGEDSRVFRDVAELGATLAELAPVTGSRRLPARVAILFDWESWWVAERDSHPSNRLRYRAEALDWYTALLDLGVRADVVPARLVVRRLRGRHRADAPCRARTTCAAGWRHSSRRGASSSSRTSPAPWTSTTGSGSAGTPGRCAICSGSWSRSSCRCSPTSGRPCPTGRRPRSGRNASASRTTRSSSWLPTRTATSRGRRRSPAGRWTAGERPTSPPTSVRMGCGCCCSTSARHPCSPGRRPSRERGARGRGAGPTRPPNTRSSSTAPTRRSRARWRAASR